MQSGAHEADNPDHISFSEQERGSFLLRVFPPQLSAGEEESESGLQKVDLSAVNNFADVQVFAKDLLCPICFMLVLDPST